MRRVLICLIVGLVGCSSSSRSVPQAAPGATPATAASAPTTTTTSIDYPALGRAYLAAVAPANEALKAFQTSPPTSSGPEAARQAAPYVAALRQEETALLAIPVPASMAGDIRSLVAAAAVVAGDLQSYAAATLPSTVNDVSSRVIVDATKAQAAANVVRSDLHLPPT